MGIISPNYGDTYVTTTGEKEGQFSKGEAKNINHSSPPSNPPPMHLWIVCESYLGELQIPTTNLLVNANSREVRLSCNSLRISLFPGGTQVTILLSRMWTIWYIN